MNFLVLLNNSYIINAWEPKTIYLYWAIVIISYFLGIISYRKRSRIIDNKKCKINIINKFAFTLLFLFLLVFSAFRDVGTDLPVYKDIFNQAYLGASYFNYQEPGYMLLNLIFNKLGFNDVGFIALISFITLFFVFKTISENVSNIDVGLSVLAFVAIYYFQSFSLVRIYLVAAFLLYYSKYLVEQKFGKYLICIVIAILFHYSAILVLLPFVLYYLYEKKRKIFLPAFIIACFMGIFAVLIFSKIPIFARYEDYLREGALSSDFGYMQFVLNIPNLLLWFYARKKKHGGTYVNMLIVYSLSALLIGMLSYKISMLGRSLVFYNIIYIVCIPYILNKIKRNNIKTGFIFSSIYVIYLFLRFILYMNEYLILDGLMPYKFI